MFMHMAKRKLYSFWIDAEHVEQLKLVRDRDGVLPSEQIRRALAAWLKAKGVSAKAPTTKRKRG